MFASAGRSVRPASHWGSTMQSLPSLGALALALLLALPGRATADEPADAELRQELQQLREQVQALEKDIKEIKQLLASRAPTSAGWDRLDNMVLGLAGHPQRGAQDASLVLIEFSDYQCPYCARHFNETYVQIERDFISAGKLRYAVVEFPLERLHPLATKAAEAAHCALDQGRFWEMHERLFTNQRQLEPWSAHAQALGLDVSRFQVCMDQGTHSTEVRNNVEQAQRLGVNSTPTFLLGRVVGDKVRVMRGLRGAAPYPAFKAEIESLLAAPPN